MSCARTRRTSWNKVFLPRSSAHADLVTQNRQLVTRCKCDYEHERIQAHQETWPDILCGTQTVAYTEGERERERERERKRERERGREREIEREIAI